MSTQIRIIGIDPGSRITGYGIIDTDGYRHTYVTSGFIKLSGDEFHHRLAMAFNEVGLIIKEWKPVTMGIEKVFVSKNIDSALKLAQARSAIICAGVGAQLELGEYSPRTIKKAVVGSGSASKLQVQDMIQRLLKLKNTPQEDEADALAIAMCHANHMHVKTLGIATASRRGRWV